MNKTSTHWMQQGSSGNQDLENEIDFEDKNA
jgi:hypothetical protein